MSCGAENEAKDILEDLTEGLNFTIPNPDMSGPGWDFPTGPNDPLSEPIVPITNEDLTNRKVNGDGTFDYIMAGMRSHLKEEYEKGRITGAEYTKAYIELTAGAMSNGVQFLLARDQAKWTAIRAQLEALTARVQLETAKAQLAMIQFQANTAKAEYALTTMKLATESINYCVAKYNLDNILPAQKILVTEQTNTQRGQTTDTRLDGTAITGSIGKQKDLYTQQITSYQRDAENKTARMWVDAWITQKTIDEGLTPPDQFTNAQVNTLLANLRARNNI